MGAVEGALAGNPATEGSIHGGVVAVPMDGFVVAELVVVGSPFLVEFGLVGLVVFCLVYKWLLWLWWWVFRIEVATSRTIVGIFHF